MSSHPTQKTRGNRCKCWWFASRHVLCWVLGSDPACGETPTDRTRSAGKNAATTPSCSSSHGPRRCRHQHAARQEGVRTQTPDCAFQWKEREAKTTSRSRQRRQSVKLGAAEFICYPLPLSSSVVTLPGGKSPRWRCRPERSWRALTNARGDHDRPDSRGQETRLPKSRNALNRRLRTRSRCRGCRLTRTVRGGKPPWIKLSDSPVSLNTDRSPLAPNRFDSPVLSIARFSRRPRTAVTTTFRVLPTTQHPTLARGSCESPGIARQSWPNDVLGKVPNSNPTAAARSGSAK